MPCSYFLFSLYGVQINISRFVGRHGALGWPMYGQKWVEVKALEYKEAPQWYSEERLTK